MFGSVKMMIFLILLALVTITTGEEYNLKYQVLEEEPEGTIVANIANDLIRNLSFTQSELQNHRYSIFTKDSQLTSKFIIDETTGVITTGMKLDRETECELKKECELSFDVGFYYTEPGTDQVAVGEKIIRIVVQLEDKNDNAPTFPERYITRNVSESTPVGQIIAVPPAIDRDMTGNNSIQTYIAFPNDGPFRMRFTKNPAGVYDVGIEVVKKLDREKRDFYRITIIAKDGGNPRKSGSVDINITVTDVNDNTPDFAIKTYTVIVAEDIPIGSTILTMTAEDEDIGVNSELNYKISPRATSKAKHMFAMEIDTGELYPVRNLDYEVEKQYQFPVVVHDSGNPVLSSEAFVVVNVTDVNDNAPQIFFKQSVFNLSESALPGTFSTVFSFTDADSGVNAQVICFISDSRFKQEMISFNYRKINLQQRLDYEQNKVIEVNVTCRDSGNPPMRNATSFTVYVQDENDNPPLFPNRTLFAHILENNKVGDLITVLTAKDIDGPGNNIPKYGLAEPSSLVTVDQHTGEIRAKVVYDCETRSSFELKVLAVDSLNPLLNSSAIVVVTVQDSNDMPPKFTQQHFEFNITENLPRNSLCGKLTAVDLDSSNNFIFLFKDIESWRNIFKLDANTGEIRTARKLAREDSVQYNFDVVVVDPNTDAFKNTADVTIYIMEDTDKPPVITFPHRFNNSVIVPFNGPSGSLIATIRAFDDGRDGQIMLTFTIEEGNGKTLFLLNPLTGELTLARDITQNDVGDHEILIAVHDNGVPRHTTYAYLTIKVEDNTDASSAGFDYLPIVISLVFVTIIIGLSIFLGIMCMRKRDRQRRERQKKMEQGMKVYTLPQDNDPDSPRYASHNALSHNSDAAARLRVFNDIERDSYKFRDDILETSFHSEEDDKISDLSHTRDFYVHGGTFDPGLPRKYQKYRQNLYFTKVDDGASDVSVATDSGRGASDEDINSNRALMFLHSDSGAIRISPSLMARCDQVPEKSEDFTLSKHQHRNQQLKSGIADASFATRAMMDRKGMARFSTDKPARRNSSLNSIQ